MPDERPNTGSYQPKHYLADFGYWAKMPHWNEVEAVALLLGINPRFVNLREEYIFGISDRYKEQYFSLLNSARRSVQAEQVGQKFRPSDWLEWAKRFQYPLPEGLSKEVGRWGERTSNEVVIDEMKAELSSARKPTSYSAETFPNVKPDEQINPREKNTMLRIIIAIAMKKYRYDPKSQRNEATQRIVSDIESLNLTVSADSVLKYLREGAEQLNRE